MIFSRILISLGKIKLEKITDVQNIDNVLAFKFNNGSINSNIKTEVETGERPFVVVCKTQTACLLLIKDHV